MRFIKMAEVLSMKNCLLKNKVILAMVTIIIVLLASFFLIFDAGKSDAIIAVVDNSLARKKTDDSKVKREIRFIACSLNKLFPVKEIGVKPFPYNGYTEQVDTLLTTDKQKSFYRFGLTQSTNQGSSNIFYIYFDIKPGSSLYKSIPPTIILSETREFKTKYLSKFLVEHSSNGDYVLDNYCNIISENNKWDIDSVWKQKFYKENGGTLELGATSRINGSAFIDDSKILFQSDTDTFSQGINLGRNVIMIYKPDGSSTVTYDGIYPNIKDAPYDYIVPNDIYAPLELSPDRKQAAYWVIYKNEQPLRDKNLTHSLWLSLFDIDRKVTSPVIKLSDRIHPNGRFLGDWMRKRVFIKWSPSPKYPYIATTPDDSIVIIDINRKQIIKTITMGLPDSIRWSGDGRYLGFVLNGSVHVYDTVKDTTTTVYWGIGCLDFIWVPRN